MWGEVRTVPLRFSKSRGKPNGEDGEVEDRLVAISDLMLSLSELGLGETLDFSIMEGMVYRVEVQSKTEIKLLENQGNIQRLVKGSFLSVCGL